MEGALPSVVGGLTGVPLVAVPTSVGYGASFGGLAALLAMLNSCAPGVTVVNIDNGFGAGVFAARVARRGPARRRGPTVHRLARRVRGRQRRHAARRPGRRRRAGRGAARAVDAVAPEPVGLAVEQVAAHGLAATAAHVEVADSAAPPHLARHPRRCSSRPPAEPVAATCARRLRAARRRRGAGPRDRPPTTCTSTRSARSTRSPTSSASAPGFVALGLDRRHGLADRGRLRHGPRRARRSSRSRHRPSSSCCAACPRTPARWTSELCTPTGAALLTPLGDRLGTAAADARRPRSASAPAAATPRGTPTSSGSCVGSRRTRLARRRHAAACSRPTSTTSTRGSGRRCSPRAARLPARPTPGSPRS